MHPRRVAAHWIPMPWNICWANSGKAAPQRLRRNVFAAIADAANCMGLACPSQARGDGGSVP